MHGALRRGLFASGLFGIAAFSLGVACSAPGTEDPSSSQGLGKYEPGRTPIKAGMESMLGKGTLRFTSKGTSLVPVASGALATSDATPKLDMELPIAASGRLQLRPTSKPEYSVSLTPALASNKAAVLAPDGSAIYSGAFGSADLVQSATLEGLKTQIAIRDEASPDLLSWQVTLADGLRAVPRDDLGTDLVDRKGDVWLSVSPVSIVDGKGDGEQAPLYFSNDGYARLRIDHRALAYPALADFSINLGSIQALAVTPTQIHGRVMVLLDTSGSMIWHFDDSNSTGGDSPPGQAVICDNTLGGGSTFACSANQACVASATAGRSYWPVADAADPSRMLAAKLALQNVVNANAGILDFGLERYAESAACPNTTNPAYCCNSQTDGTTRGRCQDVGEYVDIPNSGVSTDLTYAGSCGTPYRGGRVLVMPGTNSGTQLLPWVDFVEDFCSSTAAVGGPPRNPEIRGSGSTPLGRSIITAREDWYRPVYTDSTTAGTQPLDDSLIDCRPYVLVVMTDGVDTCQAGTTHAIDCANNNAACSSGKCFDANTGNTQDCRCSCTTNAQ